MAIPSNENIAVQPIIIASADLSGASADVTAVLPDEENFVDTEIIEGFSDVAPLPFDNPRMLSSNQEATNESSDTGPVAIPNKLSPASVFDTDDFDEGSGDSYDLYAVEINQP
jgi:hypothetical protein